MRRHISVEIKKIALRLAVVRGYKYKRIRTITGVSERTTKRIRSLHRRTGDVVQKRIVDGRPRILNGFEISFLEGCIEQQPDLLLSELQDRLEGTCGIRVSPSTIQRALKRRGLTRKTVTRPAIERDEEDRAQYQLIIGTYYEAEQLVFVDESAFNRNVSRRPYAWAPSGSRARRRDFFIRGKRYSILPALSLDGIIALDVLDRSFTAASFNRFVEGLLDQMNPWPQKNSVVIMDNASIHKSEELRAMIEDRGMRLVFLPTYSPDLNPIEEAFSSIKAWIRANRDYVLGELRGGEDCDPYRMLWNAVFTVTPEKALGRFRHSGYIA